MSVASWQLPCKSCFAIGRADGSKLTLDGDCESCWDGGKTLFKQTVKNIREQLKKNMRDAQCQEDFFKIYSQAKAAGVSETVLKSLCEQYQETSRKRTRAHDAIGERRQKMSRALDQHGPSNCKTDAKVMKANVVVGLSGTEVSIDVDADTSLEDLRSKVREAYPESGERFVKFSSGGVVVSTGQAIMECVQSGKVIYAACLKNTDAMNLQELQEELSLGDDEFQGHLHVLRHYGATHSPAHVANYLWENQILLTATQAQRIFDALVGKISRAQRPSNFGRNGPRAQLILALHSFCLEPYAIWEPMDDCDECLWANMRWGEKHLQTGRYHLRGRLTNIASSSSSSSLPAAQREDISSLRAVLNSRRNNDTQPIASMKFLEAYNYSWRTLS
eukprot:TRINITY_DN93650_c0_g1_i1.p1 TRINITY_DN93650_c0_g1~~TRINITY_DN93650_c0_g1_i1.p1  ORF type:complete len:390 (+),score=60.79 TRINITY_DN93650_c0_g1_i1:125-1294(+)